MSILESSRHTLLRLEFFLVDLLKEIPISSAKSYD